MGKVNVPGYISLISNKMRNGFLEHFLLVMFFSMNVDNYEVNGYQFQ